MLSFSASTDADAKWGSRNNGLVPTSSTVTNTIGGSISVNATLPGTKIGVQGSANGSRTSTTNYGRPQ
jgi:predicted S18 family serine protease